MSAATPLRPLGVVAVITFVLVAFLLPASQMYAAPNRAPSIQITDTNAQPANTDGRGAPDSAWTIRSLEDVAPGYCPSTGGSTQYESISDVTWTEQSPGVFRLTVQVYIANPTNCVYGEPCSAYDDSPEYVNAWVDWNGDQQWSANERVMDKALTGYAGINYRGTMTAIAQVVRPADVPASAAGIAAGEKWLRTNVGYNHDPDNPCETGWGFGNVVDKPIASNLPKIKEIQVTNAASNPIQQMPPLTNLYLKMEAILELPAGYEEVKVKWEGPDLDFFGEGNPYSDFKPKQGDHGLRTVKATLVYRNTATNQEGMVSKTATFKLFFAKYPNFKTRRPDGATGSDVYADGDGNKVVDWLQYWGRDGAVPALVSGVVKVVYNPSNPDYGVFKNKEQIIELGEAAPTDHGLRQIDAPANCVIKVGDTHGIDSVAEIVTHERKHEWVWQQWYGAAPTWQRGVTVDTDDPTPESKEDDKGDSMPDDFETTESHTDPNLTDTCGVVKFSADGTYAFYGDNEFLAMKAAVGAKGDVSKDWAYPGRQTTPPEVVAAEMPAADAQVDQKRSGLVDEFSAVPASNGSLPNVATLSGSYSDSSVDTNGDNLLEAMRVSVGVNVTIPTRYSLVGWLTDSNGVDFMWGNHQIDLTAGNHTVDLDFDAKLLYLHALNGPFTVRRVELRTGEHSTLVAFTDNAHTTAPYATTTFVTPAVTLTNLFADSGADSDSDALYNLLNIQVGVTTHTPGNYTLTGWLYDANGQAVPGAVADTPFTASGTVTLAFDGKRIRAARANGPYTVRQVEVRNDALETVAFVANAYTTAAYTANQFQGISTVATFDATTYSDQGVDINNDSSFDYLRFSLQINVTEAADYQIEAWLTSKQRTTLASALVKTTLIAGNNVVTLDFPGGPIRAAALDGPYEITGLILTKSNGDVVDYHKNAHTTQPYLHTAFALPLVALTNSYHDYASDSNGDQSKDYLNIDVGLQAGNSGVVIVQGRLVNSAGTTIQTVETTVAVTPNTPQVATLPFSATLIAANPLDGPYTLRSLLVYHTGDPAQTVGVEEAYTTAAYNHLTLQPPLTQLFVPAIARVNAVAPVGCTPDPARETSNTNDAQRICPQQSVAGTVAVVNDRDDVFRISLPANQHIRITMGVNGGDADLYFYPPNTTDVNTGAYYARSVLTSNQEIIDTTTNAAGDWFVDAYAYQDQTSYTIKVELLSAATSAILAESGMGNAKTK